MATVALQRDRSLHGGLGGALAPRDRGDGRDRREVAELDTFDARGELICDQLTCGRFASAAGARHEQEHPDSGAYPGLWPRSASSAPPELEDDDRIRQRASARRTIGMATKGWSGPPGRRKQVSDLTSRERRRCARNVTVGGSFGASGARLPGTCGCSTPEAAARFSTAPLVDRQRWLPSLDCLVANTRLGGRRTLETRFGVSTRFRAVTGQQFCRSLREDQRAGIGPWLSRLVR